MGFFVGFGDELEKLALKLPSMGEMTSGFGSEPAPAPSAIATPPAAAPQGQSVHVHVHHQAKKVAPAAAGDLPKPPSDAPADGSPAPYGGLPSAPAFGADSKTPPKTYAATGPTPGRHAAGRAAPAGTQLPSEMRVGPRPIADLGTGPEVDHTVGLSMHGLGQGLATAAGAPTDKDYADTDKQNLKRDTSGLQLSKAPPPTFAPQKGSPAPFMSGSAKITGEQMAPPSKTPKKKMYGTALASND